MMYHHIYESGLYAWHIHMLVPQCGVYTWHIPDVTVYDVVYTFVKYILCIHRTVYIIFMKKSHNWYMPFLVLLS
jgi:hypothetical protein